jgi:hypothetical protein
LLLINKSLTVVSSAEIAMDVGSQVTAAFHYSQENARQVKPCTVPGKPKQGPWTLALPPASATLIFLE